VWSFSVAFNNISDIVAIGFIDGLVRFIHIARSLEKPTG
jgi:hypothetical protein